MPKRKEEVPIAEVIRRKKKSIPVVSSYKGDDHDDNAKGNHLDDIDEEIKRLEAELADTSDSSSDSHSDDDDFSTEHISVPSSSGHRQSQASLNVNESSSFPSSGSGVLMLSKCADDIIQRLPDEMLPSCKSRKLKIDSSSSELKESKIPKTTPREIGVSDGLRKAVEEVLSGYVARSSERIPFYCRVCAKTMDNEDEFRAHKNTDFHKVAVQVEKKKTYCKLCRKQLTSIVQLQEHLKSKPHKERMEYVKAHGRNPKRDIHGSRTGKGQDHKQQSHKDSRQWC